MIRRVAMSQVSQSLSAIAGANGLPAFLSRPRSPAALFALAFAAAMLAAVVGYQAALSDLRNQMPDVVNASKYITSP
jgi:hypothetical protein